MSGMREATISALQGAQLSRHLGRPTHNAIKKARKELGIIYAAAKTTHEDFELGSRFGYAAAILTSRQFRTMFNEVCQVGDELAVDWEFAIPTRPATTDPSIDETTGDNERRRKVALWNEQIAQYERFDAYEHVFKEKLEGVFDEKYFITFKNDLLGFTHVCVSEMLDHLTTQCLTITDTEKSEKLKAALKPWDHEDDIDTFFDDLDKIQKDLQDEMIIWPTDQKIIHAMKNMWDSNIFDKRDMRDWERRDHADKGWVDLQEYFSELWTDQQKYEKATGGTHGFESAANVFEKPPIADEQFTQQLGDICLAATADKEHIQQMTNCTDDLVTVIKKQQLQITELIRQNGILITQMGSGTNPGSGHDAAVRKAAIDATAAAKKAAAMAANATGNAPGAGARVTFDKNATYTAADKAEARANVKKINSGEMKAATRGTCILCKKHFGTARCFELDSMVSTRPPNWKSLFD